MDFAWPNLTLPHVKGHTLSASQVLTLLSKKFKAFELFKSKKNK